MAVIKTRHEDGDATDVPATLAEGELAVNTQSKKLWVGPAPSGGTPVLLSGGGGVVAPGGEEGQSLYWNDTDKSWKPNSTFIFNPTSATAEIKGRFIFSPSTGSPEGGDSIWKNAAGDNAFLMDVGATDNFRLLGLADGTSITLATDTGGSPVDRMTIFSGDSLIGFHNSAPENPMHLRNPVDKNAFKIDIDNAGVAARTGLQIIQNNDSTTSFAAIGISNVNGAAGTLIATGSQYTGVGPWNERVVLDSTAGKGLCLSTVEGDLKFNITGRIFQGGCNENGRWALGPDDASFPAHANAVLNLRDAGTCELYLGSTDGGSSRIGFNSGVSTRIDVTPAGGVYNVAPQLFNIDVNGNPTMRCESAGNTGFGGDADGGVNGGRVSIEKVLSASSTSGQLSINSTSNQFGDCVISFKAPFGSTATGKRRCGDIVAGFDGGVWGTQFMAFHVGSSTSNDVSLLSGNPERMRITSTGNLLVGTTAPYGPNGIMQISGNASASGSVVHIRNEGNPGAGRDIQRFYGPASQELGSIEHNGTNSVAYLTSSDYRLKQNEKDLPDALARVMVAKPYAFEWKADNRIDEGFYAHELEDVAPYAVSGEKDGERMQSVNYAALTPLLFKAIQEQQSIIADLTARVEQLES